MIQLNMLGLGNDQIESFSLSALKVVLKTAINITPEEEDLKKDLSFIIETIESKNCYELIECNKYICNKYPDIFNVASNYNLIAMKDDDWDDKSLEYKIQSLHKIGHYIKDNIISKYIKEIAKEAINEGVKRIFDN